MGADHDRFQCDQLLSFECHKVRALINMNAVKIQTRNIAIQHCIRQCKIFTGIGYKNTS